MRHAHVVVHGRVQGVGYRAALHDTAARLGVAGWVRNRRDGAVEAELHGDEEHVQAVLDWMAVGPPFARVESLDVRDADAAGPLAFEVRGDA